MRTKRCQTCGNLVPLQATRCNQCGAAIREQNQEQDERLAQTIIIPRNRQHQVHLENLSAAPKHPQTGPLSDFPTSLLPLTPTLPPPPPTFTSQDRALLDEEMLDHTRSLMRDINADARQTNDDDDDDDLTQLAPLVGTAPLTPQGAQTRTDPRGPHQQPQDLRGPHHQPQDPRGPHQQPQDLRGPHQQPQEARGPHQQPQDLRGPHQQPQMPPPNAHQVPLPQHGVGRHIRGLGKKGTRAISLKSLLYIMAVLLLLAGAAAAIIVLEQPPGSGPGTTQQAPSSLPLGTGTLALLTPGSAFPGGLVSLHGQHFIPGGIVTFGAPNAGLAFAVDQPVPLASTGFGSTSSTLPSQSHLASSGNSGQLWSRMTVRSSDERFPTATVKSDGFFDVNLSVPTAWQPGKSYTITATENYNKRIVSASVGVKVIAKTAASTPSPSPSPTQQQTDTQQQQQPALPTLQAFTPATVALPDMQQGGTGSQQQSVTLQTTGSGPLDWQASWQGNWLQVTPASGTLQAPASTPITLSVVNNGLSAGNYTTVITFHDKQSGQETQLSVTFKVVPRSPALQLAAPATVTFPSLQEGSNQSATRTQQLQTTGVGALNWEATWDASWLKIALSSDKAASASPLNGTIQAPASQTLTLTAASNGLKTGDYSTTVTFTNKATGATQKLAVNFTITPPPPVCQLNPDKVAFPSFQQGSDQTENQTVTLTCSGVGVVDWTATPQDTWLQASPASGTIQVPGSVTITLTASGADFAPGDHATTVAFADKQGGLALSLPVTLGVTARSVLASVGPNPVTIPSLPAGGNDGEGQSSSQTVTLSTTGVGSLDWEATWDADWLTMQPDNGDASPSPFDGTVQAPNSQQLTLVAWNNGLGAGDYTTVVTFKDKNNLTAPSLALTVHFSVTARPVTCSVDPDTLNFGSLPEGSTQTTRQTVTLACTNPGVVDWTANWDGGWLQTSATSGTIQSPDSSRITLTASAADLAAGDYSTTVTFTNTTTGQQIPLTVQFSIEKPCLSLSNTSASITATQTVSNDIGQSVNLKNCSSYGVNWTAGISGDGPEWLSLGIGDESQLLASQASASIGLLWTNDVDGGLVVNTMVAGTYTKFVTFTAGTTSTQLTVTLELYAPATVSVTPSSIVLDGCPAYGETQERCQITITNQSPSQSVSWSISSDDIESISFSKDQDTLAGGASEIVDVYVDGFFNTSLWVKDPVSSHEVKITYRD